MSDPLRLEQIEQAFAAHEPRLLPTEGKNQAAVALVLRERPEGPEALFIERAQHPEDPWSGHMAFPGGRLDPGDRGPRDAAERETAEEVRVDLARGRLIGRLDDLEGRHAGRPTNLVISAFVYRVDGSPEPVPNYEVRESFWVPLATLVDPDCHVAYQPRFPSEHRYPGIVVGDPARQVVWGLTYRFTEVFLEVVGRPIPDRWGALVSDLREPSRA